MHSVTHIMNLYQNYCANSVIYKLYNADNADKLKDQHVYCYDIYIIKHKIINY